MRRPPRRCSAPASAYASRGLGTARGRPSGDASPALRGANLGRFAAGDLTSSPSSATHGSGCGKLWARTSNRSFRMWRPTQRGKYFFVVSLSAFPNLAEFWPGKGLRDLTPSVRGPKCRRLPHHIPVPFVTAQPSNLERCCTAAHLSPGLDHWLGLATQAHLQTTPYAVGPARAQSPERAELGTARSLSQCGRQRPLERRRPPIADHCKLGCVFSVEIQLWRVIRCPIAGRVGRAQASIQQRLLVIVRALCCSHDWVGRHSRAGKVPPRPSGPSPKTPPEVTLPLVPAE